MGVVKVHTNVPEEAVYPVTNSGDPNLKVLVWRTVHDGVEGYRVGLLGQQSLFFDDLETTLRRVIFLLGLEDRDILIFDSVPGVAPDEDAAA